MLRLKWSYLLGLITALTPTLVLAQNANFDSLTLSVGFPPAKAILTGYTSGSVSLATIKNTDNRNNPCIGFGSQTPDHIMVLKKDFPYLKVQINSGGKDTTLVIKGPNQVVRCGDDTGSSKDASIEDQNWKAGTYSLWVGAIEPGKNWNYKISVREQR